MVMREDGCDDAPVRGLLFVHIPKCGGQSVVSSVRKDVIEDPKQALYIGNAKQKKLLDGARPLGSYQFLAGHYTYDQWRELVGETTFRRFWVFTVLREPVARVVSLYNYIATTEKHEEHLEVARMSFRHFIESPKFRGNTMCRYIGEGDAESAIARIRQEFSAVAAVHGIGRLLAIVGHEAGVGSIDVRRKNSTESVRLVRGGVPRTDREYLAYKDAEDWKLWSWWCENYGEAGVMWRRVTE